MRVLSLAAVLCTLLASCTVSIAPATPTPNPPSQRQSELLYRALALQVILKNSLLEVATRIEAKSIDEDEMFGFVLGATGLLASSRDSLDHEFPASLSAYVAIAKKQHNLLNDIYQRWLDEQTLLTRDLPAELDAIDPDAELHGYTERLVELGYSQADVEAMNQRLQDDLETALEQSELDR